MRKLVLTALLIALVPVMVGFAQQNGIWADSIVFFEELDQPKVIAMMQSGDAHLSGNAFVAELYQDLIDAGLNVTLSYGSYNELLLCPAVNADDEPFFSDGRFNATGIQKVREGITYLIDRQYIVDEILDGLGVARVTTLDPNFPPYSQAIEAARAVELKYRHDAAKAEELIAEGLTDYGAEFVGGKWMYGGEQVLFKGLIRVEDERLIIGNYFADLLEGLGFAVERIERTSGELVQIWLLGDPNSGDWNYYTGGWISNLIDRDGGGDYDFFFTPRGWQVPLNQGYPIHLFPEADAAFDKLGRRDYSTVAERKVLLQEAELGGQEAGWHQWLFSAASPWAWPQDVSVLVDVAAGISGAYIWAHTARFVDEDGAPVVGGTLRMASPSMLTTAWNPVAGSNWLYDAMIQRATEDWFLFPDPFTGLYQPHLVESAVCTVEEGIPMGATLPYVTVETVPSISVPGDAWVDWDATVGDFITRAEKFPGGLTAKTKTAITFSDDLLSTKWHDGSTFSLGDMLFQFILGFDVAKPESPVYDEAQVAAFEQFITVFKGARITGRDPVQIEVYHDAFYLDAEAQVFNRIGGLFWPYYSQGMSPWHTMAASWLAEEEELTTWSEDKADKLGVDRQNWVAGESLTILLEKAEEAQAINFIPYTKALLPWINPGEIYERYENMKAFLAEYGHLWIGNGPMMIESIDPIAKIVVGVRFDDYIHDMNKFLAFSAPKLGVLEVDGPDTVAVGGDAVFDATLTYEGEAYAADEIQEVKYLVFDATGELAFSGLGVVLGDGQLQVSLSADETAMLIPGSSKIEIIAVLIPVAKPSFGSFSFIVQ
ncbi:ABC transporter substrate-binding protein [Candidatus Bipolaricaulota bacterium]